jgi:toxin ParE1/3/4
MHRRILLRPQVPGDLASIVQYLATRSPQVANRFAAAAQQSINEIAQWPGKGSPKQFSDRRLTGVRSWSVRGFPNHLIFYRPISNGVEVLAVLHGARDLPSVLKQR